MELLCIGMVLVGAALAIVSFSRGSQTKKDWRTDKGNPPKPSPIQTAPINREESANKAKELASEDAGYFNDIPSCTVSRDMNIVDLLIHIGACFDEAEARVKVIDGEVNIYAGEASRMSVNNPFYLVIRPRVPITIQVGRRKFYKVFGS